MTTNQSTHMFAAPDRAASRRGVALLLVVVTLATATVLTTSYLISRESAPEIGEAAQARITADWSARTAAGLVEAAMETTAEWRSAANAGMLLTDMDLLGANVNVCVTNLDGGPVADDDRHVLVTVTAVVDGIETVVQRVVSESDGGDYTEALDPELNEFGVYATNRVSISSDSRVMVWSASPAVRAGAGAKVGLGFTTAGEASAHSTALPTQARVFKAPGSTAGLDSMLTSYGVKSTELPVQPWATTAEPPEELIGMPAAHKAMDPVDIRSSGTLAQGGYGVPVSVSGTEIVLDGTSMGYLFTAPNGAGFDLMIDDCTVTVRGDVKMALINDLGIRDTLFNFEDNATLTIYHAGDIVVENSVIGASPDLFDESNRSAHYLREWTDPRRVRFVQLNMSAHDGSTSVTVRHHALIVASVHSPTAHVRVGDNSAIAGRVSAGELSVDGNSALLLDPTFDNRLGITEPKTSPLYDIDGDLLAGLKEAMELTSASEGISSAKARLLAALPEPPVTDDTDVNGATRRHADTVRRLREWPVRVRLQENDDTRVLFEAPDDETIADALGATVSRTFDFLSGTASGRTETSTSDVLKITMAPVK